MTFIYLPFPGKQKAHMALAFYCYSADPQRKVQFC